MSLTRRPGGKRWRGGGRLGAHGLSMGLAMGLLLTLRPLVMRSQGLNPTNERPKVAAAAGNAVENSLGMRFVPVPGTPVWFCVWETRVRDYQVFVNATQRFWEKTSFPQGPTHPAVNVSWDDAQAFCQWLTAKERAAGQLKPGQKYRLPTDLEWSAALGLRNERGADPHERGNASPAVFPWGKTWPPPAQAGNYCDRQAASRHTDWLVIPGYDDGYAETAPVGSYKPNDYGLYDLGGNAWEWCEDWCDGEQTRRVLRGASWYDYDRESLSAACRNSAAANSRFSNRGFRVVVGLGP